MFELTCYHRIHPDAQNFLAMMFVGNYEPQTVSDIQDSQTRMREPCTTEIRQMHRIHIHNAWTTYHRVQPGVQNSQATMLVNEQCTNKIICQMYRNSQPQCLNCAPLTYS